MRHLFIVLLIGCVDPIYGVPLDGSAGSSSDETGWCQVQEIFQGHCLSCHGSAALGGLDLSTDPHAATVGQAAATDSSLVLVVPGDPQASFLYRKAAGLQGADQGTAMPPPSGLPAAELAALEAWIADGASEECSGGVDTGSSGSHHPQGFADPAVHGEEAKLQLQQCVSCHGADLTGAGVAASCDTCHAKGWRTDCTFCHGGDDNLTGAPPRHISGEDEGDGASFIPHTPHVEAPSALREPLECGTCHTTPDDVLSKGHLFVGDSTPGQAEVRFSGVAAGGAWSANAGSCTVYCHGNGRRTGDVTHTAQVGACDDCHAGPSSGRDAWDQMSGEHEDHLREGITCSDCHDATTQDNATISDPARHINGTADYAGTLSYNGASCTGTCHGEGHQQERWD